ncbi:probable GATA transcription factor 19 at N-terminal half [Coccomyxa sp. Obi]|nr:probable GATA transcription factor 19 at N-terminal half [Coccomyxa sp. Obi]
MDVIRQTSQDGSMENQSVSPAVDLVRMQSSTTSACSSESRSADTGSPGSKVCVTCGTRKTPMWRTNTDGQKTLCNACGVRLHREQKKAKIARSGSEAAKSKADPGVQILPRSRSKSQSLTPEAKVAVSGESATKAQRKRSWEESLEPRRMDFSGVKSKEQQSMYRMNSGSAQQQQQASMVSWQSLNVLSEELGRQEMDRLPHSLPIHFSSQMGMPADADLDPLDPAFLASINDPCSSGKVQDPFTYELNAAGSCLTEDRSEQTLLYNHARAHHHSHEQPMKPLLFSSPTGEYRPGPSYGISPTGRSHIPLPVDMSTPDSHMWMAQEGYFM